MKDVDLTTDERRVLPNLGDEDCCYPFATMMTHTGLSRDRVRRACRSLREKGLADYHRCLITEDGLLAGSGYAITPAGRKLLKRLEMGP